MCEPYRQAAPLKRWGGATCEQGEQGGLIDPAAVFVLHFGQKKCQVAIVDRRRAEIGQQAHAPGLVHQHRRGCLRAASGVGLQRFVGQQAQDPGRRLQLDEHALWTVMDEPVAGVVMRVVGVEEGEQPAVLDALALEPPATARIE